MLTYKKISRWYCIDVNADDDGEKLVVIAAKFDTEYNSETPIFIYFKQPVGVRDIFECHVLSPTTEHLNEYIRNHFGIKEKLAAEHQHLEVITDILRNCHIPNLEDPWYILLIDYKIPERYNTDVDELFNFYHK